MSFEDKIRQRISQSSMGSVERDVLKLILGECQQQIKGVTEEQANNIVKKMIKSNEECLIHLAEGDVRVIRLKEENEILSSLLPQYWTVGQIKDRLVADGINLNSVSSDGQAMGLVMKHLKQIDAPVEGNTVKQAISELRGS